MVDKKMEKAVNSPNIRVLSQWSGDDYDDVLYRLVEEGYEIGRGQYSVADLAESLDIGVPVFVRIGDAAVLLVGIDDPKNPQTFYGKRVLLDGTEEVVSTERSKLERVWDGVAVHVLSDPTDTGGGSGETTATAPGSGEEADCPGDRVIFREIEDTWPGEWCDRKDAAKKIAQGINEIDICYLPLHPVIVDFREPTKAELKKGIRSSVRGPFITIHDPHDIPTQFFHELGHVYWDTRVTDAEKEMFYNLYMSLDRDNPPPVFLREWSMSSVEEFFATVYLWYVKGLVMDSGYKSILWHRFRAGYQALDSVFKRIERDQALKRKWDEKKKEVREWVDFVSGRGSTYRLGKAVLKAKVVNGDAPPRPPALPVPEEDLEDAVPVYEYGNRTWYHFPRGMLKGRTLVCRDGNVLDTQYMSENMGRMHLLPTTITYQTRSGRIVEKTSYKDSSKVLAGGGVDAVVNALS